ncbi:MAG: DUF1326 domain-containing protein [Nitrosopumilus sp.]|nr:DUF1326 domain-containing protein [Nitrosopumilus sp.]
MNNEEVAMISNNNQSQWKIEGDYFEGCSCKTICPCVFMLDPNEGECKAALAWHIEKGYYNNEGLTSPTNGVSLDNLNAAAMLYAPGNMFTGPKMKAAFYFDEKANDEQTEVLTKIFSGQVGGFFSAAANLVGEVLGIKSVPMEFAIEGKRRKISIPSSLELELEALKGGDENKDPTINNPSFWLVPGYEPVIARTNIHTYKDHGLEWDNAGKNAYYSRFTYHP